MSRIVIVISIYHLHLPIYFKLITLVGYEPVISERELC
jgi:hypothetical protein